MPIRFYRSTDPYYELTNHSAHPTTLDGLAYPTVEHYDEEIRTAPNPMLARRMGRSKSHPIRPDWDDVKEEVMFQATLAKFESHADARASLLDTGDEELVEASPHDAYWGSGPSSRGWNRYGQILMQVRAILKNRDGKEEKG